MSLSTIMMHSSSEGKIGGKTGLANLGNTCYMNSAIQCLSNTKPFREYFLSGKYKEDLEHCRPEWIVTKEMARLLDAMWERNQIVEPKSFKFALSNFQESFVGFRQHDSHELLVFLLDLIHKGIWYAANIKVKGTPVTEKDKMAVKACEEWKKSFVKEYSFIVSLFYGQYHCRATCECGEISDTFEPFSFLHLPITRRTTTLYHCLNEFTHPEELDDDNKRKCDKCDQLTNAKRQFVFWKTPDVLIITLKRFNFLHKNGSLINFPIEDLDLKPYVNGYDSRSVYDLFGVINHVGGTTGGHYYSYCKRDDGNWYEFNDTSVTPMDPSRIVSNSAYVLFYKKKSCTW